MNTQQSEVLFERAQKVIPGGVNSPVRAFRGVGGQPIFIARGHGAYLVDVDGNEYIDYVASWGPLIVGHAHPEVVKKVASALQKGFSFGAPTLGEIELAELICSLVPSIEMIRFVSSGTEATMSAIRLARGFTKRPKIVKFSGCYHGHADGLLVAAGSGALTLGVPSSAGVPNSVVEHTLLAEYNDLAAVKELFLQWGEEIAAIIVEPVAGNMNCILPQPEFLPGLRQLCDQYNSVLIFDEVMTGFRAGTGGAQEYYAVKPDLTTLGKIIGGGFPVGAFGGKTQIMQQLAPLGPVYQAGTLSGNPVAMACGLATLQLLTQPDFYLPLFDRVRNLLAGLSECAQQAGIPLTTTQFGTMFGIFFTELAEIKSEGDVKASDITRFSRFFHAMLDHGVYFPPSAFEAGFLSASHGDHEIEKTLAAARLTLKNLI